MIVYVCLLVSCLIVLLCVCFVCLGLRLVWFIALWHLRVLLCWFGLIAGMFALLITDCLFDRCCGLWC